jgi:uncharacterized protein YdeI (YjbR/CyaY-like superfamily)
MGQVGESAIDTIAASMKATFFATPSDFRAWLEENHDKTDGLWVGFYKKGSGNPSITYREALDEALCFGWIDSVRKTLDEVSYVNRFTPRKRSSRWSAVNIKRAQELTALGRMRPAGLEAFEKRSDEKSAIYSYEQRSAARLDDAEEQQFRANTEAWEFFQAQPNWYRRTAIWWVTSAKRHETRSKRLAKLIEDSEQRRTIPPLTRPTKVRGIS